MWEWLAKEPLLKLFDVGLGFLMVGLVAIVIYFLIKAIKKIGTPVVGVDDKGRLQLTIKDKDGNSQLININAIELLLETKDKEIHEIKVKYEELSAKFGVMEAEMTKNRVIADYSRNHKVPLTEHSVFFNLRKNVNGGVPIECDTTRDELKVKVEIAKIYLEQCKMPIFYDNLYTWVDGFDSIETDVEAFNRLYKIQDLLYAWIEEYSKKAEDILVELSDGRTFKGIPEPFIEAFNKWHDPHVQIVMHKIKDVLYNSFYETWQLKLIVILDHIDTAFYLTVKDAETTIVTINGRVEKSIQEKLAKLKR